MKINAGTPSFFSKLLCNSLQL